MFARLFLCFLILPFVEVVLLIKLGQTIGFTRTVLAQVLTAVIGASLAQQQGLMIWQKVQKELAAGKIPKTELVDGFLVFIAGIVLLTPGLITDAIGIMFLFPVTRFFIRRWLVKKFENQLKTGNNFTFVQMGGNPFEGATQANSNQSYTINNDNVIDVEPIREDSPTS